MLKYFVYEFKKRIFRIVLINILQIFLPFTLFLFPLNQLIFQHFPLNLPQFQLRQ